MTSSPLPVIVNRMQRQETGLYAAYEYVCGDVPYEKTVARLGRIGTTAQATLGKVHLQEAAWSPQHTDELLDKAEEVFTERVYSEEMGFDADAVIKLAQIPLYRSILGNPKFPSQEAVEKSHGLVLEAARTALNHFGDIKTNRTYQDDMLFGTLAEIAPLLLANKHCLDNRLTDMILPLQALLAEDLGTNGPKSCWDMSLYLPDRKNRPTLGYKLQIKATDRSETPYARDIVVLRVDPDLHIESEVFAKSAKIIAECLIDSDMLPSTAHSKLTAQTAIAARTEKMLTVLDRFDKKNI